MKSLQELMLEVDFTKNNEPGSKSVLSINGDNIPMSDKKCSSCNQIKKRGKVGETKAGPIWNDENGDKWHGRVCPACYKVKNGGGYPCRGKKRPVEPSEGT